MMLDTTNKNKKKKHMVKMYLTQEEYEAIRLAAFNARMSMSKYVQQLAGQILPHV